jgi:hypothetical protein
MFPQSQPRFYIGSRHRRQQKRHSAAHGPVHMSKVKQAGVLGGFPAFAGQSRGQSMAE